MEYLEGIILVLLIGSMGYALGRIRSWSKDRSGREAAFLEGYDLAAKRMFTTALTIKENSKMTVVPQPRGVAEPWASKRVGARHSRDERTATTVRIPSQKAAA